MLPMAAIADGRYGSRIAVGCPSLDTPRTDPDEPNSTIRLLPWVFDGEAACRTRLSAWVTRYRLWVQCALCWSAFPLVPALGSTASATGSPALFGGFTAVGSEEARSIALALASVRRSNWACSFPAPSFHEDAAR